MPAPLSLTADDIALLDAIGVAPEARQAFAEEVEILLHAVLDSLLGE